MTNAQLRAAADAVDGKLNAVIAKMRAAGMQRVEGDPAFAAAILLLSSLTEALRAAAATGEGA